jgi:L-alanine-DL-glutamate epimerase-like enolase superfamily enzyme
MVKCIHLCEAHGVAMEVHGGGHANLHGLGAMAIPGEYYERGLLHPLYDYEAAQPWLASRCDNVDSEGYIAMPEAPGMGLDLDWGYINRNRV